MSYKRKGTHSINLKLPKTELIQKSLIEKSMIYFYLKTLMIKVHCGSFSVIMIACNEDGLSQLESADALEDESGASIFEG